MKFRYERKLLDKFKNIWLQNETKIRIKFFLTPNIFFITNYNHNYNYFSIKVVKNVKIVIRRHR